jgi:hypothetical protein
MTLDIDQILRPNTLHPSHIQELADSDITPEAAKAAGIASVPPRWGNKILGLCGFGWAADKVDSILAFRYRSLNGNEQPFCRFKITPSISTKNGKTAKYLQPKDTANRVYIPPGVDPQGKDTLYITEGEKKTICLTLNGFPCIGLGGVYGWLTKNRDGSSAVIPDFGAINWHKRDVVIVFDADIAINDQVRQAEEELAQELISQKARVFIVRLPYSPGCAKGVDDFIKRHGKAAFAKLPRKAVKPRKMKGQTQASVNTSPDSPFAGTPYLIDRGRLSYIKQVGAGRNVAQVVTPLCNFVAQCQEEIVKDDGRESSREFLITGTLDTGQALPQATVKAPEFRGMGWLNRHWGMAANISAGQGAQDRAREAIQHLSPYRQATHHLHS